MANMRRDLKADDSERLDVIFIALLTKGKRAAKDSLDADFPLSGVIAEMDGGGRIEQKKPWRDLRRHIQYSAPLVHAFASYVQHPL